MSSYTIEQVQTDGLPLVLGYLIPIIAANTTITYRQIGDLLQKDLNLDKRIFSTRLGGVAGALMYHLQKVDKNIPLVNVLIVNQDTGAPGDGVDEFLRDRFGVRKKHLPPQLKVELVDRAAREVYAYPKWMAVYNKAFGQPAPKLDPVGLVVGTEQDGSPADPVRKRGGEAESIEHKALKAYVLANPGCVGLTRKPDRAESEKLLLSGDEVDVYFETEKRVDLIEVKSIRSDQSDIRRGIYQCVKYRAVFNAQRQSVIVCTGVLVTLVLEVSPSAEIRDLAKRHNVRLKILSINQRPRQRS